MEGWQEIRLKELISEMADGGTPSTINEKNFGGNIPWAVVEDVTSQIYSTHDTLTEQGYNNCSAKLWPTGTIILTTGATIGKVGIAMVPLCTKQGITGIVCNKYSDSLFIKYWLEANTNQLIRFAQGTTFKEIRARSLGNLRIKVPNPFTERGVEKQKAIAKILSKVDEAIASVQNCIASAERLKKSLMQNLLTGKMKPDGIFRTPEEFYIDEKFGKVPVGWEVKKVQELSIQVTDGEHQTPERTETGYYLLSARNIKNGYLSLDDVDYIPEKELRRIQKRCNPQAGDILISCSGTIGNVCIVPDGFIGGMVRSAALVKLNNDKIESQFAELMFQSHYLQNQMKVAVASSVQGNIFQGAIKKLRMFYPHDKQERLAITKRLYQFNREIASMQDKIIVLERLKKSLMQNLLTGKVIVRSK